MSTARKRMDNFKARWQIMEYDGNLTITRLPDGSQPRRDPRRNKRATFLAELPVGVETEAPEFKNRQSMSNNLKVAARRILGNNYANWSARTVKGKVLVRRLK